MECFGEVYTVGNEKLRFLEYPTVMIVLFKSESKFYNLIIK